MRVGKITAEKGPVYAAKVGNVTVKVYQSVNRDRDLFTVAYQDQTGSRKRVNYSAFGKAKSEAQRVATKIHNGEIESLNLVSTDRTAYLHALDVLKPSATPLHIAANDYAKAREILGTSGTLIEAARFYVKHHATALPRKTVREVLDEFLAAKAADQMSDRYLSDCESRLGKFAARFTGQISEITTPEIQDWLDSLELSARGKNNTRAVVVTLFGFARTRQYLPKNQPTEAEELTKAKERQLAPGIFTPGEMAALLTACDDSLVPYVAIGGFAGLRSAEVRRLDWSEVKLDQGHIEVKAEKAKTAQRRLVPIHPNLAEWLGSHAKRSGKVCLLNTVHQKASDFAKDAGLKWPNNVLRHSYGSYRLADCKNTAEVALEMGNSPQIIFSNYREVVTPTDARAWFSISPMK